MEFCLFSQCTKQLEFTKYRKWPSKLPAIAWKKYLLCGFERSEGQVVDFSDDLAELLKSVYSELSLTELAQLLSVGKDIILNEDREKILKSFSLKPSHDLYTLLKVLPQTPIEFQDLVHHKKISAGDLAPLRAISNLTAINELLISVSLSTLSKSQAVLLLEMAIELYLMEHALTDLLKNENETSEAWLERIMALRRPMTRKSDQEFTLKSESLNWPNQVKGEWVRRGDQSGLQISLYAVSKTDLNKKLLGLNKVNDEIWNKS